MDPVTPPVPNDLAADLIEAAAQIEAWTDVHVNLILRARRHGCGYRQIAGPAGVTHQTVANICKRHGDDELLPEAVPSSEAV